MKLAGLLLQNDAHHLDHIAPLCALLSAPLITNCEHIHTLVSRFYPCLEVIKKEDVELPLWTVYSFTHLITTTPKPLVDLFLFPHQDLTGKKITTFWCPHGFSDKGSSVPFFEALADEDGLFYYGDAMLSTLKKKLHQLHHKELFSLGNYRMHYSQKHASFYKPLLQNLFPKGKKLILYAPTWSDGENSSSVDALLPHLVDFIPENIQLLLRLHPNTLKKSSLQVKKAIKKANGHPQITLVNHIPTVLPILSQTDVFIGDRSSIGYDFLPFNRPMFFAPGNSATPCPLFDSGKILTEKEYPHIFSTIEKEIKRPTNLEKQRNSLYNQVFDPNPNFLEKLLTKAAL